MNLAAWMLFSDGDSSNGVCPGAYACCSAEGPIMNLDQRGLKPIGLRQDLRSVGGSVKCLKRCWRVS